MQSKGWIFQISGVILVLALFASPASVKAFDPFSGLDKNSAGDQLEPLAIGWQENEPSENEPSENEPSGSQAKDPAETPQEKQDAPKATSEDENAKTEEGEKDKEQEKEDGSEDLNRAFDLKLEAQTIRDLDKIVGLCAAAIKKGLNKKDTQQAKDLAAECAYSFADQLGKRIFKVGGRDKRWQYYRAQALPKLKLALQYDSEMISAFILQAKLNGLPGGDRDAAQKAIERAIELSGEDKTQLSDAFYVRGTLAKDAKARLKDLNRALEINPKNLQALKVRASYYISKNQINKAVEDFEAWLDGQPENYEARLLVVESLIDTGDKFDKKLRRKALGLLEEAVKLKPDSTVAFTIQAQIHELNKDFDQVVKTAGSAIELEPKNIEALEMRARALANLERYDEALEDADEVIKLQGFALDGIELRATIRLQKRDYAAAIEDLKILSEANPDNVGLSQQMAQLYVIEDQPSMAIPIYNKLLRSVSKRSWRNESPQVQQISMIQRIGLLRSRGDARLSIGEHKLAIKDYEEAIELDNERGELEKKNKLEPTKPNEGILNNLAWVLATSPEDALRDGERAIELARQAAELTEFKEAYILSTLASAFAESGDYAKAIEWVEKALVANTEEAEKAEDKTSTDRRFKSLNKELESYKQGKPWREKEDVEAEANESEGESDDEADSKDEKENADQKEKPEKSADKDD